MDFSGWRKVDHDHVSRTDDFVFRLHPVEVGDGGRAFSLQVRGIRESVFQDLGFHFWTRRDLVGSYTSGVDGKIFGSDDEILLRAVDMLVGMFYLDEIRSDKNMIYDVSMLIHTGMPVYKNKEEKKPIFRTTSDFTTGSAHETNVSMDVHCGTHIDAPLHMIPNGATIECIALEQLVRPVKVFDLTHVVGSIQKQDVALLDIAEGDFVLFKTSNSFDEVFNFEFIYIAESAARHLADIGIAGVGIDGLGVERAQPGHETHTSLMNAGVVIIEGLRLKDVAPGEYLMTALPLKMAGIDAAPARVILSDKK